MRWIGIAFIASMIFIGSAYSGGVDQVSGDPRLDAAYESYQKGVKDEERGDEAFRGSSGRAQRMYEHAEGYYLKAAFQYEQLSTKYDIDLKKEIAMCNDSHRSVHVKTNKARTKAKGR